MVVTYPLGRPLVDDSGTLLTGATVAVASVKDKAGTDVVSHGATASVSGANASVDYDAEAKGEAWVTLSVSKVGSTVTGENASPAVFAAKDSGRVLGYLTGDSYAALAPFSGLFDTATVSAATSANSFTLAFTAATAAATVVGNLVSFQTGPLRREKGVVASASQGSDSSHVVVTFTSGTFSAAPGVGNAALVG